MRAIKPLIGAVGTPTPQSMIDALKSAGFRMIRHDNASIDGLQSPLIERADGYFRTTRFALLSFVRVGLLPTHFRTLFNRLTQDCDAFIEADRARLITTSYHWLAEKPKSGSPASSETAVRSQSLASSIKHAGSPAIGDLDLAEDGKLHGPHLPFPSESAASSDTAVATPH